MASGLVRSALSGAIEDENVKNMDNQRVKKMIDVEMILCHLFLSKKRGRLGQVRVNRHHLSISRRRDRLG